MVPIVDLPDPGKGSPASRRLLANGPMDGAATMRLAAALMELDGRSADVIELVVNSDGGQMGDIVGLLDVIGAMRARVETLCLGRAIGTGAILVACGTGRRRAGRNAQISLRCSQPERLEGSTATLRAQLEDLERIRRHLLATLATATGQPSDTLDRQLDDGPFLNREEAIELGLLNPSDGD